MSTESTEREGQGRARGGHLTHFVTERDRPGWPGMVTRRPLCYRNGGPSGLLSFIEHPFDPLDERACEKCRRIVMRFGLDDLESFANGVSR